MGTLGYDQERDRYTHQQDTWQLLYNIKNCTWPNCSSTINVTEKYHPKIDRKNYKT